MSVKFDFDSIMAEIQDTLEDRMIDPDTVTPGMAFLFMLLERVNSLESFREDTIAKDNAKRKPPPISDAAREVLQMAKDDEIEIKKSLVARLLKIVHGTNPEIVEVLADMPDMVLSHFLLFMTLAADRRSVYSHHIDNVLAYTYGKPIEPLVLQVVQQKIESFQTP